MKEALTNVDVAAMAAELRPLVVGARIQKAYQPEKEAVVLRLRQKHVGRLDLLCRIGSFLTVVRRPPENPQKPSMVAQILRATFENARVTDLRQIGFDRLLRLETDTRDGPRAIVFELFGDGNLLILDEADRILLPMRGADHGARRLRKGEPYQPPPGGAEPLRLPPDALRDAAAGANKDIVRFLALDMGFGPQWAEELLVRAAIDKKTRPQELGDAAWQALHDAMAAVAQDLHRNDLAPVVVYREGEPVDVTPWPLQVHDGEAWSHEEAPSWREAVEVYFLGTEEAEEERDDPRAVRFEEARGKLQRQIDQMATAIDGFREEEAARRQDGETLYARFQDVETILADLERARSEHSWKEVQERLAAARDAGHAGARQVLEVRPQNAQALLRLETTEGEERVVQVDLRRSVQENAEAHYEAAKKARSRREGAEKALGEVGGRMRELEEKGLTAFGEAPKRAAAEKRHFWFEAYRWTVTPAGFVAVGGRSAAQNDTVVKKYLRDGDRYVHAEMHGAPSVVVRPPDGPPQDIPEADLRLACQFAACASRAWRQFGQASAYWVTPQQVSKTPRSGEFVPRGAWIIHGKRNVEDKLRMQWAVAAVRLHHTGAPVPADAEEPRAVAKVAGGPPDALRPFATSLVVMEPGELDPNDAAGRIAERLGVPIEAVQQAMPPGPVRFLEGMPE